MVQGRQALVESSSTQRKPFSLGIIFDVVRGETRVL